MAVYECDMTFFIIIVFWVAGWGLNRRMTDGFPILWNESM